MSSKIYIKEISSNPEFLPDLEEFILDVAKETGLDNDQINSLSLSFSEAVSNSIVHGNKGDSNKKIRIKVEINSDKIIITIKDEGKGFNPEAIPDPTKPENILKDSGRGIHIMKSFLNDLKYNFTPNGTETILTLHLNK
ncbi:MAG: ATP-binding protein [Ignavibacteria bacterium]|nr:ATP-binding protein [Ignavibacteria bacterium]